MKADLLPGIITQVLSATSTHTGACLHQHKMRSRILGKNTDVSSFPLASAGFGLQTQFNDTTVDSHWYKKWL